ncbi:MAG: ferrous iron transport protein B [Saprospiraceae bacterium]|nr:ferrous iron transport protein B [Saprospiraceae bacterium]
MTLYDLEIGEKAIITKVKGRGAFRKRILEMGFVSGKEIFAIKKAPLKDPVEYNIMGYNLSLRNSEAKLIEIVTEKEIVDNIDKTYNGTFTDDLLKITAQKKGKIINVAFVGNPNCGKTTIFNFASGSKEKVGNYGGVTVDAKQAKFKLNDYTFNVVDLPGTYSITSYSPEELYVREYIFDHIPDIVVNVIDGSNLERNLYLTTQLIDMDIKVVIALNMFDELQKSGDEFNYKLLGKMVGIPFVPTVGSKGKGITELLEKIVEVYEDKDETVRHIHINYGKTIEKGITEIQNKIKQPSNLFLTDKVSSRFLAIKLIENDGLAKQRLMDCENYEEIIGSSKKEIIRIEETLQDITETLITDAKYGFISGALKETLKPSSEKRIRKSDVIDTLITHKLWGIPIFIFFMWLSFFATFKLGQYPVKWIEYLVALSSNAISSSMPAGILKDLLIQGIVGGVGGVIVFLPNILLLYFFIAIMEDTGYMARAVFIMDKAMHKIGLHGKSFIPLLMGFGCNVPAILSTRIIESRRDRLITMLINPFMSCSARLPVYILFISAFFVSYQGTILFSIYGIGVLLAILSALLFKKSFFKTVDVPFVMELPPYRIPTIRSLIKHMWHRAEQYLKKIGGVILIASIIIWALGYFPQNKNLENDYKQKEIALNTEYYQKLGSIQSNSIDYNYTKNKLIEDHILEINNLRLTKESIKQENSYIGRLGKFIEPVMRPLGIDWKISVGILTGVAAKEIFIGTIGVLYQVEPGEDDNGSLITKLQTQTYKSGKRKGQKVFSPLVAFVIMLFVLIYFPCIGVISAISKESGSWKWAAFTIFYTTALAWIISFAVFQIGSLF